MAKKVQALVFPEQFIVDTQIIEKEDVAAYIDGRSRACLGEDYYYAYTYQEKCLSFFACSSKIHLKGRIPAVAPAFCREGVFECTHNGKIFRLVNSGGGVSCNVVYSNDKTATVLNQTEQDSVSSQADDLKFMALKWSLDKPVGYAYIVSLFVFLLSVLLLSWQITAYNSAFKKASNAASISSKKVVVAKTGLPDVSSQINKAASEAVSNGGTVKEIRIDDKTSRIVVTMEFPDEVRSQKFLTGNASAIFQNGLVLVKYPF